MVVKIIHENSSGQNGQKSELLPKIRPKPKISIEKRLEIAKIRMLLNQPFFGVVLLQMGLYPAEYVDHIYANTKIILYNPEYFENLKPDEIKSALLHGVLHCVLNHIERGVTRNLESWELATDYALSFLIQEQNLPLPPDHPYNLNFRNKSAEQIYEILMYEKKNKQNCKNSNNSNGKNKGNNDNEDDERDENEEKPYDKLPDFKDLMNNDEKDGGNKKEETDVKDKEKEKGKSDNNPASSSKIDNKEEKNKDNTNNNGNSGEENNLQDKDNDRGGEGNDKGNNNDELKENKFNDEENKGDTTGKNKGKDLDGKDRQNEEHSNNLNSGNNEIDNQNRNSNNSNQNDDNNLNLDQNGNRNENGQKKENRNENTHQNQSFKFPIIPIEKDPYKQEPQNLGMNGIGTPNMDLTLKDLENFKGVIREAYSSTKSQDILPADLIRQIDEILNPKLDWRQILAKYILKNSRSGWKWVPPNYKYLPMSLVIPSNHVKALDVIVAVDTSGSISTDELIDFISEVQGIVATASEYKLTLISCDSRIHDVLEYDNFHPIDYKEVKNLRGGGGTDFRPVFDYIEQHRLKPDCLLYMTDGYGKFPSSFQPFPVLWMMTTEIIAPMGLTIKYAR